MKTRSSSALLLALSIAALSLAACSPAQPSARIDSGSITVEENRRDFIGGGYTIEEEYDWPVFGPNRPGPSLPPIIIMAPPDGSAAYYAPPRGRSPGD